MPVLDDVRNPPFGAASDIQDNCEPKSPDNNEPTTVEPEPASNARPEPELSYRCGINTLDLGLEANHSEDQTTSRLAPKKTDAALALSLGENETEVARLIGVHRTTIYRWQQEAGFVAEVNRMKREYLTAQRMRLNRLLHLAMGTVETCLERPDLDMRTKMKAAMFILSNFAPRAHEAIGPISEWGVKKMWQDEAKRLSTSGEVHLLRVTEP